MPESAFLMPGFYSVPFDRCGDKVQCGFGCQNVCDNAHQPFRRHLIGPHRAFWGAPVGANSDRNRFGFCRKSSTRPAEYCRNWSRSTINYRVA